MKTTPKRLHLMIKNKCDKVFKKKKLNTRSLSKQNNNNIHNKNMNSNMNNQLRSHKLSNNKDKNNNKQIKYEDKENIDPNNNYYNNDDKSKIFNISKSDKRGLLKHKRKYIFKYNNIYANIMTLFI